MKLVIGLGNIGKEYELTRHNVGFLCLIQFAAKHNLEIKNTRKYSYMRFKDCLLIMPKTFMNRSGEAYASAVNKYHGFDDVLVISDDIELPLGKIRIRPSGGSGGHNGLKSIIEHTKTIDVRRIRIGIGRPESNSCSEHVLDKFTDAEGKTLNKLLILVNDWLLVYIQRDFDSLLNEYSKWNKDPIPSINDGINRPKEDKND